MLEAVDDFCKFLGPELKAVTGDDTVVDEVARMVQVGCAWPARCTLTWMPELLHLHACQAWGAERKLRCFRC